MSDSFVIPWTKLPCPWIFQVKILEWVAISFSGDLPYPGIEPQSPALAADPLPLNLRGSPVSSNKYQLTGAGRELKKVEVSA